MADRFHTLGFSTDARTGARYDARRTADSSGALWTPFRGTQSPSPSPGTSGTSTHADMRVPQVTVPVGAICSRCPRRRDKAERPRLALSGQQRRLTNARTSSLAALTAPRSPVAEPFRMRPTSARTLSGAVDTSTTIRDLSSADSEAMQLRDRHIQVTGLGRQRAVTMSVAFGDTALGAFPPARADVGFGLGLDQFLQHPLRECPDQIGSLARLDRSEQFSDGRLVESHRRVLLRCALGRTHRGSRRWLTAWWTQTPPLQGTHNALGVLVGDLDDLEPSLNLSRTDEWFDLCTTWRLGSPHPMHIQQALLR